MSLRVQARAIFDAGVAAADPVAAVTRALDMVPMVPDLIVALGKAAGGMARAALARCGPVRCLVITNDGNDAPIPGARVMASGHPVPDARGAAAAGVVIAALERLPAGAKLLVLISGGGSALLPAPVPGVSLADKAEVSRLLLASGADIGVMNLIRQNLSRLKGGGLLRLAVTANARALILSDVVGDDLRTIASGPTAPPLGAAADAVAALRRLGLWDRVPESVRAYLLTATDPGPLPPCDNRLIGSNALSLAAMAAAAPGSQVVPEPVTGDVADAARLICDRAGRGVTLWGHRRARWPDRCGRWPDGCGHVGADLRGGH